MNKKKKKKLRKRGKVKKKAIDPWRKGALADLEA